MFTTSNESICSFFDDPFGELKDIYIKYIKFKSKLYLPRHLLTYATTCYTCKTIK